MFCLWIWFSRADVALSPCLATSQRQKKKKKKLRVMNIKKLAFAIVEFVFYREKEGIAEREREAWMSIRPSPISRPPALGCCCCHHWEMRVNRASSACRPTSLLHPSLYQSAPKITATMWPKRPSFTSPTAQHAVFNRIINADMVQSDLHHSGFLPHKMKRSPPSAASCTLHLIFILHRCASSVFGIA